MSKHRPIEKRYDLNEYEASLLRIKSKQCGLREAQYIRELITGHAPKEAPGKEFYDAMNDINKIGNNINQIAAVANSTGVVDADALIWLRELYEDLKEKMLEIKTIVLTADPYHYSYYEKLIYEQKKAREEGRPEPKSGDNLLPNA